MRNRKNVRLNIKNRIYTFYKQHVTNVLFCFRKVKNVYSGLFCFLMFKHKLPEGEDIKKFKEMLIGEKTFECSCSF